MPFDSSKESGWLSFENVFSLVSIRRFAVHRTIYDVGISFNSFLKYILRWSLVAWDSILLTVCNHQHKLTVYPEQEYGELFDLHADPYELHNRWDDEEYEDIKARLYRQLIDQLALQEGAVPSRRNVA